MNIPLAGPRVTRRAALASSAAAATSVVVARGPEAQAAPKRKRVAVGVLVVNRLGDEGAGARLVRGFRIGAEKAGLQVSVSQRTVAAGARAAHAGAATLIADGAQVIVAAVAAPSLGQVADLCKKKKVALVVANSGAHAQVSQLDGALVNSLQLWQSAYGSGKWAAKRLGPSLFSVIAAPDAGYDSVYGFSRGFVSARGREVGRVFTHQATGGVDAAARAARDSGAAVVRVHAHGVRSREIVAALRRAGVQAQIVVDPLSHESTAGKRSVLGRARTWTASSWQPLGTTSHARRFARAWKRRHGGRPDAWALLGHDTAFLVAEGVKRARRRGKKLHTLPGLLAGAKVPGARGPQLVDRETRVVSTPLVVRRSRSNDLGATRVEAKLSRVEGDVPGMVTAARGGTSVAFDEYTTI